MTKPIKVNCVKKQQPVETESRPLFAIDEMVPFKGVWFKVVRIEPHELVLKPVAFTKEMRDKMKAGTVVQEKADATEIREQPQDYQQQHS